MVSLVAVAVVAVASRRPAPQRRGKPKHVQTELQRCGMAIFAVVAARQAAKDVAASSAALAASSAGEGG